MGTVAGSLRPLGAVDAEQLSTAGAMQASAHSLLQSRHDTLRLPAGTLPAAAWEGSHLVNSMRSCIG